MKNFKTITRKIREYDIEVTLQSNKYKGNFVYQVLGRYITPYNALLHSPVKWDSWSATRHFFKPIQNNCNYEEFRNENGEYCFKVILKDEKGNQRPLQRKCSNLANYIVKLEVIHYRDYEPIMKCEDDIPLHDND